MSTKNYSRTIPDLNGKRAVVTGASDGIGLGIATELAGAGAEVLMPVRNLAKGEAAMRRIRDRHAKAKVALCEMDLSSLSSITAFTSKLKAEQVPVNLLINNAGVMTPPQRQSTAEGFEIQFGTNHLGHFALTGQLLPLLQAGAARVTTQTSVSARHGSINWDDLNWQHSYSGMRSYGQSKLACGLFGLELARRSAAGGWGIHSTISHPGVAPTALLSARPEIGRTTDTAGVRIIRWLSARGIIVGNLESAKLPALLAATSSEAETGSFYGPQWLGNLGGPAGVQKLWKSLQNTEAAARIWQESVQLTGTSFEPV